MGAVPLSCQIISQILLLVTLKLTTKDELDDGFVTWEGSTGQVVGYQCYKPSSMSLYEIFLETFVMLLPMITCHKSTWKIYKVVSSPKNFIYSNLEDFNQSETNIH